MVGEVRRGVAQNCSGDGALDGKATRGECGEGRGGGPCAVWRRVKQTPRKFRGTNGTEQSLLVIICRVDSSV